MWGRGEGGQQARGAPSPIPPVVSGREGASWPEQEVGVHEVGRESRKQPSSSPPHLGPDGPDREAYKHRGLTSEREWGSASC